jgi:hypothetical protein
MRAFAIASADAIAVVLVWWAYFAQPVQLADVTPQLNSSLYLGPFAVTGGADVGHGNVPLQVTGMLTEAAGFVAALELDTRPSGEPSWQKQTACCTLLGSSFTGSASLSVASAQAFDFQLVSVGNSIVLATGTLAVHLESFPGAGNKQSISSPVSGRQRSSWSSCALCPALCPGCSGGPPVLGQARPN